ncbi:MAG: ornithine cyclodeaminase family protein, partial [Actinobacteria bacterium]|nr:ornithine cyclodeaminase family protein [Actinomycetota bacterium]
MLVLTRNEVEELLDLDALIEALAGAHAALSAGDASLPPRVAAFAADAGLLGAMPAYLPSAGQKTDASGVLGCKLVSLFPGNRDRPTHQAAIALFDPGNGSPVALMDGTYITATR